MTRMYSKIYLGALLLPVITLQACAAVQKVRPLHPERWIGAARQAGSNRKQARSVILDAYVANDTVSAAKAFETLYKEKPGDPTRRALYAYAVAVAYLPDPNHPEERRMYDNVTQLLFDAIKGPDYTLPVQYRQPFTPSKVPEDWLAWGVLMGRREALIKATELDPKCAEAYYYLAYKTACAPGQNWKEDIRKYGPGAWEQLARAEQIEPKLHGPAEYVRAYLCFLNGDSQQAEAYLRNFARISPNAPLARFWRDRLKREARKGA